MQHDPDHGQWLETTATVYLCLWRFEGWQDLTFSPADEIGHYVVSYAYSVDGEPYDDQFAAGAPFEEGDTFSILYNTVDPQENTGNLARASSWKSKALTWIAGLAFGALLIWVERKWFS